MKLYKHIRAQTDLSDRTIRKLLHELEEAGDIVVNRNADQRRRHEFRDEDLPKILETLEAKGAALSEQQPTQDEQLDEGKSEDERNHLDQSDELEQPGDLEQRGDEDLLELVRQRGAEPQVTPKPAQGAADEEKEGEGPSSLWIMLGVGVLLVAVVLVAVVLIRRRAKRGTPSTLLDRPLPQSVEDVRSPFLSAAELDDLLG